MLLFGMALSFHAFADDPVIYWIGLQVHEIDPNANLGGVGKGPTTTPEVGLSDHTLYFAEAFSEVVAIELKDANGTVVYSTNLPVGSSSVILPSTLSGNYTIYIIYISGYIYYGQISL